MCRKELAEAETADKKIDESIHFCFLELNAWREITFFGGETDNDYFTEASANMKNIINFCDDNNAVHCVSELLDYYMECSEVKSEKRKLLAKEAIENVCHVWKDMLPKELLSECKCLSSYGGRAEME